MPNWKKSNCVVAGILNAALVCLPALVVNGGHVPPCAAVAIVIAAVCEGLVTSPQRVAGAVNESGLVTLWNVAHGVAVLICLQSLTAMSTRAALHSEGWQVIGAILLIGGVALRTAALWTLGDNFADGFKPSASRRVTVGPYRFLRHPAELGLLLIIAGFGTLVCGWSILTAALFAFLTAVSTVRVIAEELALRGISENDPSARLGNRACGGHFSRHAVCSPLHNAVTATAVEPTHVCLGNARP